MKSAAVILAVSAAAFALPAAAQMNNNMMSNVYIGATVGQARYKDACTGVGGGVTCDDKDTAWRALVGYQINPMFSLEGGYHDLGSVMISSPAGSASFDTHLWELVGIAAFPIQQFNIYGKLGGYRATIDGNSTLGTADDTSNGWTYGAGAGFEAMKNLGLRLEWQRYREVGTGTGTNIDVMSIGALWRFR